MFLFEFIFFFPCYCVLISTSEMCRKKRNGPSTLFCMMQLLWYRSLSLLHFLTCSNFFLKIIHMLPCSVDFDLYQLLCVV